jgi:hypothetical protein
MAKVTNEFWEDLLEVFGKTFGRLLEDFGKTFGKTLGRLWEDLWKDFGKTLGRLWEACRRRAGRRWIGISGSFGRGFLGKEFFEDGKEFLGNLEKILGIGWGGDSDGIPKTKSTSRVGRRSGRNLGEIGGRRSGRNLGKWAQLRKVLLTRIYTLLPWSVTSVGAILFFYYINKTSKYPCYY